MSYSHVSKQRHIQKVGSDKDERLHHLHVIRVVTHDPGQTGAANLLQLLLPEWRLQGAILIVEAVTKLQGET